MKTTPLLTTILSLFIVCLPQALAQQDTENMTLVAQDNCGVPGKEPNLVEGQAHSFGNPAGEKIDKSYRTTM